MTSRTAALALPLLALVAIACGEKARVQIAVQPPPPETVFVRQPEPVAPPKPPLDVSPRSLAFDAIGDTARLALPDGAACVAASDSVAQVDSTGLVRAAANGQTHLRCWLGDRNASVRVSVAQQLSRVAVVADEGLALRRTGDSLHLNLARVDRLGTPVADVRPTWASLSPEVVRVDPASGVAVSLADTGTARIVGSADRFADTVIVEIGAKNSAPQLVSTTTRTALSRSRTLARANAQRARGLPTSGAPTTGIVNQSVTTPVAAQQPQAGVPGIGVRISQPQDSLFQDPSTMGIGSRQRAVVPTLTAGFMEHRLMTGAGGLEKRSGAVFGGAIDITTRGLLSFRLQFLRGTLAKDTTTAQSDIKFTDGTADAYFAIAPWLSIIGGGEARRYQDNNVSRWIMLRAGGEATFNLGGGGLYGIAQFLAIPLISVASDVPGTPAKPSFGLTSALGLGFENRRISSSLVYDIERYSFPSNASRKEQFGALLFRFGYRFGW